jgi:hypothetical protein
VETGGIREQVLERPAKAEFVLDALAAEDTQGTLVFANQRMGRRNLSRWPRHVESSVDCSAKYRAPPDRYSTRGRDDESDMVGPSIQARSSADRGALASHCAMSSAKL